MNSRISKNDFMKNIFLGSSSQKKEEEKLEIENKNKFITRILDF